MFKDLDLPRHIKKEILHKIIEIAEENLSTNQPLDITKIINQVKYRLDITRKESINHVKYLLRKNILVEGSKYTRKTVLKNEYRNFIYSLFKPSRVLTFSDIKRKLSDQFPPYNGSSGQLVWHLEMLLKFSLIDKIKVKNSTIFKPIGMNEENATLLFLARDDVTRKIMQELAGNGGLSKDDIIRVIAGNRNHVSYRLEKLKEFGIITRKDYQPDDIYQIPATMQHVIKNLFGGEKTR